MKLIRFIQQRYILYTFSIGYGPFPVTVTTRIITFFVGNPYKPLFASVTGKRLIQMPFWWPTYRISQPSYKHVFLEYKGQKCDIPYSMIVMIFAILYCHTNIKDIFLSFHGFQHSYLQSIHHIFFGSAPHRGGVDPMDS